MGGSVASLHMLLSKSRITKALIRLRGCAGWSVPVLFANARRPVFSRRGPFFLNMMFLYEENPGLAWSACSTLLSMPNLVKLGV